MYLGDLVIRSRLDYLASLEHLDCRCARFPDCLAIPDYLVILVHPEHPSLLDFLVDRARSLSAQERWANNNTVFVRSACIDAVDGGVDKNVPCYQCAKIHAMTEDHLPLASSPPPHPHLCHSLYSVNDDDDGCCRYDVCA